MKVCLRLLFRGLAALGPVALLVISLTACGNPRTGPVDPGAADPPANSPDAIPLDSELVLLRPVYAVGSSFRTIRKLVVVENTETEEISTESVEVTLTRVLRVDESGRMLAVRRTWESSLTRFRSGFEAPRQVRGELDGVALELTQRAGSVEARVVAGKIDLGPRKFVLEGFDAALLPVDAVKSGARWTIPKERLAGLNRILKAMDFVIEKNRLLCKFHQISNGVATIVLDWRLSGEIRKRAAVLHFTGELRVDTSVKLITYLSLIGGRGSQSEQIKIEINRRPVKGWLDLDD